MYITICRIDDQCKFYAEAGHSKPVLWDNPEGWCGEGGGRVQDGGTHVHLWLIHVDVWQKPPQYCNVIIPQLKLISLKKLTKKKCGVNVGKCQI